MPTPPSAALPRLEHEHNIWFASMRPDGRPHLVPLWFVWHEEVIYVCVSANSVKARNIQHNDQIAVALESGDHPVIAEGTVAAVARPWPDAVQTAFQTKYDWSISADNEYGLLLAITPTKWLEW